LTKGKNDQGTTVKHRRDGEGTLHYCFTNQGLFYGVGGKKNKTKKPAANGDFRNQRVKGQNGTVSAIRCVKNRLVKVNGRNWGRGETGCPPATIDRTTKAVPSGQPVSMQKMSRTSPKKGNSRGSRSLQAQKVRRGNTSEGGGRGMPNGEVNGG